MYVSAATLCSRESLPRILLDIPKEVEDKTGSPISINANLCRSIRSPFIANNITRREPSVEKPWQTFEESEIFLFFLKKGNERVSKKLSDNIYIYKNSKGDKINWLLQSFEESGIFFSFSKKVITEF